MAFFCKSDGIYQSITNKCENIYFIFILAP